MRIPLPDERSVCKLTGNRYSKYAGERRNKNFIHCGRQYDL